MVEKIKEWAWKMNLKKAIGVFVICGVIYTIAAIALLYNNFGSRLKEAEVMYEQQEQTQQENSDNQKYNEHNKMKEDQEGRELDLENVLAIDTGDKILVGVIGSLACLFGIVYWILCIIWAYRKAVRIGQGTVLWPVLTLFFNLGAILLLYIYTAWNGTCPNCGHLHLRKKNEKYCTNCGQTFIKECPECKSENKVDAKFCSECGKEFK